jgi:ubiquinone/menaquinone biosynthesis C-methylase UbiE
MDIFQSLLAPLKPGRLLDLGCGIGNFSQMAHAMGWKVTAVDARGERLPSETAPDIEWVESDMRDYRFDPNDYDCVCVLGLLYHLEMPAQIDLLRRCSDTFTLLDTHTALQGKVTEQGYEGKYYKEVPWAQNEEQRRAALGSSWGNRESFWPTEESLMKMLEDSGFSLVSPLQPAYLPDRTFYLCYP